MGEGANIFHISLKLHIELKERGSVKVIFI